MESTNEQLVDPVHAPDPSPSTSSENISPMSKVMKFANIIGDELKKYYINIEERFPMMGIPSCLFKLEQCLESHYRNEEIAGSENNHVSLKFYLANEKLLMVIQSFHSLLREWECPDADSLLVLLEVILTVNCNETMHTSNDIIQAASTAFVLILKTFPPCWKSVRPIYKNLFEKIPSIDKDNTRKLPLFDYFISLIESAISANNQTPEDSIESQTNNSSEQLTSYKIIEQWELADKVQCKFTDLSFDDQIDRSFRVLYLLVSLLEKDFIMWFVRHPFPQQELIRPDKQPLAAFVFWFGRSVGDSQYIIEQIIKLFMDCINRNLPKGNIDILARLINLISILINQCEVPKCPNTISFPNISFKTHTFTSVLINTMINQSTNLFIDLLFKTIPHIHAPFIRYLLITKVFETFETNNQTDSLIKKIFIRLDKRKWKNDYTIDFNLGCRRGRKIKELLSGFQYLKLSLIAFQSYVEFHRIDKIYRQLINPNEVIVSTDPIEMEVTVSINSDRINYDELEEAICDAELTEDIRIAGTIWKSEQFVGSNRIYFDSTIALNYRNDLKFYTLLIGLIIEFEQSEPEAYDVWKCIL